MKLNYFTPASAAPRPAIAAPPRLLAPRGERPTWDAVLGVVSFASGLALAIVVILGLILG
jgi:hypothetical protein